MQSDEQVDVIISVGFCDSFLENTKCRRSVQYVVSLCSNASGLYLLFHYLESDSESPMPYKKHLLNLGELRGILYGI